MRSSIKISALCLMVMGIAACQGNGNSNSDSHASNPPPLGLQPDGVIVKSVFKIFITGDAKGIHLTDVTGNPGNIPITVINGPDTEMTVSTAKVIVPPITSAPLTFGSLLLTNLTDNNLRGCGTNSHAHCGTAIIRVYTTGAPGAGFYNITDGYGMPITATPKGGTAMTVGLGAANSVVIQSLTIPNNQNVLRLADFSPAPEFEIKSDFSNAGAGTYSATIVVEYGLLP
ncbi:MAG: hypothetical protein ACXVA9_07345 [Bdellovibrionales bacterium]